MSYMRSDHFFSPLLPISSNSHDQSLLKQPPYSDWQHNSATSPSRSPQISPLQSKKQITSLTPYLVNLLSPSLFPLVFHFLLPKTTPTDRKIRIFIHRFNPWTLPLRHPRPTGNYHPDHIRRRTIKLEHRDWPTWPRTWVKLPPWHVS